MGRDRAEDGEAGKVGPRVGPYEDHARRHERQPEREAQASVEIAFKAAGETVDRRCGDHRRPEDFGERAVEDERGPVHEHKGNDVGRDGQPDGLHPRRLTRRAIWHSLARDLAHP